MKQICVLFVCLFLLIPNALIATTAPFDELTAETALPLQVEQCVISQDRLQLGLSLSEEEWYTVGTPGNEAELIAYPLAGVLSVAGKPAVPSVGRMFRIPPRSGVVMEVTNAEYVTYSNVDYAAFLGAELDEVYGRCPDPVDEWYPGTLATVSDPAIFHDFRVASLTTYPVQVNTARREVRIYSTIDITIRYEGTDERNSLSHWPTKISEAFLPAYRLMMDWRDDELDEYELYFGHVQVVMVDDPALWTAMEDWIEWKRQRGWILDFLTDEDVEWTSTDIRNELEFRYENADPKFDYVVIVGDDTGAFPVPPGSDEYGPGDQPYSELAGNDILADVGVGRISVETVQEVYKYTNKVFCYERTPYMDDPSWFLRGLINRSGGSGGNTKIMALRYYRHAMLDLGYTDVDSVYSEFDALTIEYLNAGVSFYAARGVEGSGLHDEEITSLMNDFMTPVVIDVTCGTGNWSEDTGMNELYMRAGTVSIPTGGICGMSMATSSTMTNFNNCLTGGAGWAMLQLGMPALGDMILMSKVNGWTNYAAYEMDTLIMFMRWFNLIGDPTVWTWVGVPREMNVEADTDIELGDNAIRVYVSDENGPLEDAQVTFYKYSLGETIQVTKRTDQAGYVILDIPVRTTGEATTTAIKRHYAPVQIDVNVTCPNARVGWVDMSFVDDGTHGTRGDGDGVPDAGETVGIQMALENHGIVTVNDIEIHAEEHESMISNLEGVVTVAQIESHENVVGDGLFLLDIDPATQNNWILHLDLSIESSLGNWEDACEFIVSAPEYGFVSLDSDGALDPGETRSATIEIINIGRQNASASTAWLYSNDPFILVEADMATLPGMNVNQTGAATFSLRAHDAAVPGYTGWVHMQVSTADGHVDTVGIPVQLGNKSSTDPAGPDKYGYYAFDNLDTSYTELAPVFDWVEINPEVENHDFEGVALALNDNDINCDRGVTLDLPFEVQYYGQTFDEISVSTNGYAAFGRNADISLSRNWTIPSPLGPNNMVAVYWDEFLTLGDASILYYHDQQNGRFIIEWYAMQHFIEESICTFELIIFDQNVAPTWSGDNNLLFQYDHVDHLSEIPLYDVPFWTTGIENHTQDDGILIAYWNNYTPGSSPVENGSAILFTTNIHQIVGHIAGSVTASGSEQPIENVWLGTRDHCFEAFTDADGRFFMENVMVGPVALDIEAECFNPLLHQVVTVAESETLYVHYELGQSEFAVLPATVRDTLDANEQVHHSVWVRNPGTGEMNWEVYFSDVPDSFVTGEELWEQRMSFELEGEEYQYRGIEFDGEYFWLSGSDNYDPSGPNLLYKYSRDGVYLATFEQPVPEADRSPEGMYGLAWDGEYLYGADNGIVYQMRFNAETDEWRSVNSFGIPLNPARFIAYNQDSGEFYIGDRDTDIYVVHPDSEAVLRLFEQDFAPRGAAWRPNDPDKYNLYIIGYESGGDEALVVKMNPVSGDTIHAARLEHTGAIPVGACLSYRWDTSIWMFASLMNGGQQDHVQVWKAALFHDWLVPEEVAGTVAAGDSFELNLELNTEGLVADSYSLYLNFQHDACIDHNHSVYVTITDPNMGTINDPDCQGVPVEWAFQGVYPNPFNPNTTVLFSLKQTVRVHMIVYNILGQKVACVADQTMQAGHHKLIFNGVNLASGVYFLHLDAGPLDETRKIVLMK